MSDVAIIDARDLSKRFGRTTAVDTVSVRAERGVIGLLGPNGAGKTTLLRMLATVLPPSAGELRLFGSSPGDRHGKLAARRRLGYLPQQPGLYPGFSGFDLVDYVAVLKEFTDRRARHDEVRRVLAAVDLSDDMHRRIRTMSGGQQRRVAIAAALIGAPELLLLDEPAAGLDPEQRMRLRSVLADAGRRGCVVLSTHHTEDVAALCTRVVVCHGGRIRFDGAPAELAALAAGHVWVAGEQQPGAVHSWFTAEGTVRSLGTPPAGAELVAPTLDDGYLLLTSGARVPA